MRFLADMGISPRTVEFLRDAGHDAVHLLDRGLHELGDPDILQLAREEERILLVHDLDFSDLVAASGGVAGRRECRRGCIAGNRTAICDSWPTWAFRRALSNSCAMRAMMLFIYRIGGSMNLATQTSSR